MVHYTASRVVMSSLAGNDTNTLNCNTCLCITSEKMIIKKRKGRRIDIARNKFTMCFYLATFLTTSGHPPFVNAQEQDNVIERLSVEPELGAELRYDENIFRSSMDVKASWISILAPRLTLTAQPTRHRFDLKYAGEFAWYADSSPDNYDDHDIAAGAYLELGQRSRLDLTGSLAVAHENRGTGLTEGFDPAIDIPAEPDQFRLAEYLARYTLGSDRSKGRVVIEGGLNDLEYQNHRERTRFFDRDDFYGNATFYLRIFSKTSLLINTRATDVDYKNDLTFRPSLDNKEYRYFLGATWDTTAKTKGTVKFGYMQKSFSDPARGDFSDPSWEVDIRWSPRTYSHFDFASARLPSETNGLGSFVDNTTYAITWRHEWNRRIKSDLGARNVKQLYRESVVNRKQEFRQYVFSLSYQMRRWLSWRFGVELNDRDSNIEQFRFDGNVYNISVLVSR